MLVFLLVLFSCANDKKSNSEHEHVNTPATTTGKSKSPASQAMANIGNTHVHIEYHAPSVRGRMIFGGLVAYDEVWVTGAHSATSINFPNDIMINGEAVPKGKYALFTIPGRDKWTVIINKNFEQHLADDYDQSLDVLRFQVEPEKLNEIQDQLLYEVIDESNGQGSISISWSDVKITFNVSEI